MDWGEVTWCGGEKEPIGGELIVGDGFVKNPCCWGWPIPGCANAEF